MEVKPTGSSSNTRAQFVWTLTEVNRNLLLNLIPPISQSAFVDVGDSYVLYVGNSAVCFQINCASKLERAAFLTSLTQRTRKNASSRNS